MKASHTRRIAQIVAGELGPVVAVSVDRAPGDAEAAAIRAAGADVIEYRLDRFEDPRASLGGHGDLVTLMTVRTEGDGGSWRGSDAEWLELLADRVEHFDLVDIEIGMDCFAEATEIARAAGTPIVASAHDFGSAYSPEFLNRFADRALGSGADLAKAACVANSEAELRVLAQWLLDRSGENLVALAMSSMGPASRCLLPLLGSRLTFGHLSDHAVTTGQMPLEETVALLRRFSPTFDRRKSAELSRW